MPYETRRYLVIMVVKLYRGVCVRGKFLGVYANRFIGMPCLMPADLYFIRTDLVVLIVPAGSSVKEIHKDDVSYYLIEYNGKKVGFKVVRRVNAPDDMYSCPISEIEEMLTV